MKMVEKLEVEKNTDGDKQKSTVRRRKMSQKRLELEQLREENQRPEMAELIQLADYIRPKIRNDCSCRQRPCPFISCKHHLFLDINEETGTIKFNFPEKNVWEMKETCALDVADRGGITLEEVGEILNLTRERIRQVEVKGLCKLRHHTRQIDLVDFII